MTAERRHAARVQPARPVESHERQAMTARTVDDLGQVQEAAWDACAGSDNPFLSHAFLLALEESGSCAAETGWLPQHVLLEDSDGELLGALPLYLKNHSQGEYVFDHSWAHAFERAGGRYYPKLQASVPFTPVTGPRLLTRPGPLRERHQLALINAAVQVGERFGVSSLHVTFPTEDEWRLMGECGFLRRTGEQFHWHNDNYERFDDFLRVLTARRRKTIRKERATAVAAGIDIQVLTGSDLKPEHWDAFFRFYTDTGSRKWGSPYLTRSFFDIIHDKMADKVALVMCRRGGRYIAGALNFIGTDTLYGRNWGCIEDHDCLHFEACYYQAIEFAIDHGLKHVEAGAQGPHKVHRGYLPRLTYSAHWIADTGFRRAVADYLERERDEIDYEITAVGAHYSPYNKAKD